LNEEISPFFFLDSLSIVLFTECRLHIFELGLFDHIQGGFVTLLNANGKRVLSQHLLSDLLNCPIASRIRRFHLSEAKLQGSEVRELMEPLCVIWPKVLIEENLKPWAREFFQNNSDTFKGYCKIITGNGNIKFS
jgi:hypothetical protein